MVARRDDERARQLGVVGACRALQSVGSARGRPRDAPSASAMHVCVNARLSVRVPVHGVGESDRLNRMYSDMKYIFCEYLRPFAAREEHAVARARVNKARRFMVSPACSGGGFGLVWFKYRAPVPKLPLRLPLGDGSGPG